MQTYYNTYNRIKEQEKARANRTHEQKVKEAHKALTESEQDKLIAEANDWLQKELDGIERTAEKEALNAVNSEVYSTYITGMQELKDTIRLDQAMGVVREVDSLLASIEKQANNTFKDFNYISTALKKEETELDKQENAELRQAEVDAGLALSDEKEKEKNQLLVSEKEKRDTTITNIKQSDEYRQELTEENKAKQETENKNAEATHEANEKKIGQAFGQEVTDEQIAKQQAEKDAVNKAADKQIEAAKNENKELSKEIDELAWEIAEEQVTSDETYDKDVYNIKLEYGQIVTEEKQKQWDAADKVVEDKYDTLRTEQNVLYGRELPEDKKLEKQIREDANDELLANNIKLNNIEYGLQLSDELQNELEAKFQALRDEQQQALNTLSGEALWKKMDEIQERNKALKNDPKYQTKDKSDLTPQELSEWTKKDQAAKDAHKVEEEAIENEYKLEEKEVVNGVKYSDAIDNLDEAEKAEKEVNETLYGKTKLDDMKEQEMDAKLADAKKQKQDRETEIKGKENKLKDLKKQNEKVEDKIEDIEENREKQLKAIDDKEEYKTRDFKDDAEEQAYKDAMKLEEERYEAQKKEIEEKYGKKKLTDEEKRKMNAEIADARQKYKDNVAKIQEQYKVKDFDELTKAQQDAYKKNQENIKKKYDNLRKEAKAELKAKQDAHKLVLQLEEIKCEQFLDNLKNDYKNSMDMLEIAYEEGRITKDEYKEQKKKLNTEYEREKQGAIAAKQKVLDEERRNWASEKKFEYTVSTQIVTMVVQDAVNNLTSNLNSSINKYAEKLGDYGAGVVTGVTQQLVNHYGQELVNNVVILWNKMWGTTAQELGVRGFKLDWGQLGLQILFSWASNNEHLAEIVSGIGGFLTPSIPVTYETYAVMNFGFISKPFTALLPSLSDITARKIADKYADQSIEIGDSGKWRDDPFGTNEVMGYNPLQFTPMGSSTMIALIPPYIFVDTKGMKIEEVEVVEPLIVPWPLPTWVMQNVSGAELEWGEVIQSYTGLGKYADTAYIVAEFGANFGNDSYVQRAFSLSSLGRGMSDKITDFKPINETVFSAQVGNVGISLNVSIDYNVPFFFEPTVYSVALNKEAIKYQEFALKCLLAGSFAWSLKDLTDQSALKTRYLSEQDIVLVGPFKVDYIYSGVKTEFRTVHFGMMTNMKIYYRDETTQEEKEISKDTWNLLFEENGEINFGYSEAREGADYIYPYPKENFYIAINKSANPYVTNVSKIKMDFKEMQTIMVGHSFSTSYEMYLSISRMWPVAGGGLAGLGWHKAIYREEIAYISDENSLFTVMYAKRFYMNWHMDIVISQKEQGTPAYETADRLTTAYETVATVRRWSSG